MRLYSEACERNKESILAVLHQCFAACRQVLEVGSGTGQHAVHFAAGLPHLSWRPSDLAENLAGIESWRTDAALSNLLPPIVLDLGRLPAAAPQALDDVDALFTANTLHMVSWEQVQAFFQLAGRLLPAGGPLAVYGPFSYAGRHTAESNARFDLLLRDRDPASGVRNFEDVDALAQANGLTLGADHAMPANNRTLVWYASR